MNPNYPKNNNDLQRVNKYDMFMSKIMNELKYVNNEEKGKYNSNNSRSLDERIALNKYTNPNKNLESQNQKFFSPHIKQNLTKEDKPLFSLKEIKGMNYHLPNRNRKDEVQNLLSLNDQSYNMFQNQKKNINSEGLDAFPSNINFLRKEEKSPLKLNEIKGINYNFPNRNKKDEVKNLLFLDNNYKNPIEKVYEDAENPLKITKKDYNELVSNPNKSITKNFFANDISNYEVLKKKFVNYIHFNIHKESIDQKIIEKAQKIRECEEKKFLMSKTFKYSPNREKYNQALEKRIIVSFDDVFFYYFLNTYCLFSQEKKGWFNYYRMSFILNSLESLTKIIHFYSFSILFFLNIYLVN